MRIKVRMGRWSFVPMMMSVIAVLATYNLAGASMITVNNFSFESPDVPDNLTSGVVTGWSGAGLAFGLYDPTNTYFSGTSGDNANTLGILPDGGQEGIITTYFGSALGGSLSQTVGTVAPHTIYTLTISVGTALALPTGGWTIELLAGSTVIASNTGNSGPPPGTTGQFVDELAVSPLTGDGTDPNVGQNLTIKIIGFNVAGNTATAQDQFDDVRLTSVPEPASAILIGGGALLLLRRRAGWAC